MHHALDHDDFDAQLDSAATLLRAARRVACLTGAGVSAESGVATFRGAGGLWEGHRVEDVATPEAFARDPRLVWRFNNARRNELSRVEPNDGHRALAAMERRWGAGFTLITQNIDGLHQKAGSRNVLELHGRISRVRCTECKYLADRPGEDLPTMPSCPECGNLLRVDVVWFGEMLPYAVLRAADHAAEGCEVFLVAGTSAVVYPAAGLIHRARSAGARVIEVNPVATPASEVADVCLRGPSGRLLPEIVRRLG